LVEETLIYLNPKGLLSSSGQIFTILLFCKTSSVQEISGIGSQKTWADLTQGQMLLKGEFVQHTDLWIQFSSSVDLSPLGRCMGSILSNL
jgi:hypothetical protein